MTEELFRDDATLAACDARITVRDDAGVQLDRTVFQVTRIEKKCAHAAAVSGPRVKAPRCGVPIAPPRPRYPGR
jgi:hypothetical protein